MMKKNNWIYFVAFFVCFIFAVVISEKYSSYKMTKEIEKIFDDVDRQFAIEELIELRGRVVEIQHLSRGNTDEVLQEKMMEDLEDISKYDTSDSVYHNKYLDNIQIHIPEGSIEYKTEMVIEQIDDIVDTIK